MLDMAYKGGYEKSAHLYDLFDTKENIEFFRYYASNRDEILDIGAGTGRIAIPIAEKGVKIYCVEPSPSMLAEFKRKLSLKEHLEDKIFLINEDAFSFNLSKTFSVSILSGTFDHFINDMERRKALENINKHLKTEGLLIFDVFIGLMIDSPLHPAGTAVEGNIEYRRYIESKILPEDILEVLLVYEIYEYGELTGYIEQKSSSGIITRKRVHQVLKSTGFKVQNEYSDYDFSPYGGEEELLIIESVKK